MPNYKGHLAGGLVAYAVTLLLVGYHQPLSRIAMWLMFCLFGSLFPDVDTKSKGQKIFYRIIFVGLFVLLIYRQFMPFMILSLFSILPALVNHRGIFHRLWFLVVCSLGVYYLVVVFFHGYTTWAFWNLLFFLTGAISHLWLDVGFRRMVRLKI